MKAIQRIRNISRYGFGREARLRKQAEKARLRLEQFYRSDNWQVGTEFAQRRYSSYEDYVEHQKSKLAKIVHRLRENEDEDFAEFKRRFETCPALREARSVLCLGARLGTEVRALHALGYFAVGIDLNPGADNQYVLPGDFHHVVFPDGSVDAIYTNAMDHVLSVEKVVSEISRLLRPGGLFVADLVLGYDEGFIPGEFEATHWRSRQEFIGQIAELGGFRVETVRDLGLTRRDLWTQAVFRKPA